MVSEKGTYLVRCKKGSWGLSALTEKFCKKKKKIGVAYNSLSLRHSAQRDIFVLTLHLKG